VDIPIFFPVYVRDNASQPNRGEVSKHIQTRMCLYIAAFEEQETGHTSPCRERPFTPDAVRCGGGGGAGVNVL